MKKFIYISVLAILVLFSCSKEQPLSPVAESDFTTQEMSKAPGVICSSTIDEDIIKSGDDSDDSITDPEKDDKEKSNKKAKN